MADIVITTSNNSDSTIIGHDNGIVWTGDDTGYYFHTDSSGIMHYSKTTDGGSTYATAVSVGLSGAQAKFSVWYDKWTSGNSGNIIHIAAITGQNAVVSYISLDTSSDTLGTPKTITSTSGLDVSSSSRDEGDISIVKAIGGNLCIAHTGRDSVDGLYQEGFERSTDSGANWTGRAEVFENTGSAAVVDKCILIPLDETDTNDVVAIFSDTSATELSRKVYDDSANSWAETSIDSAVDPSDNTLIYGFSAVPRHSDGAIIVICISTVDDTTGDLRAYEVAGTGCITNLTDVYTDEDNHGGCALFINQNDDTLYAVYTGDPCDTWSTGLNIRYKSSTNGGSTWSSATQLNEDTAGQNLETWAGVTVGDWGGRFMPSWGKRDASPDEYVTNKNNSVAIAGTVTAVPAGNIIPKVLEVMRLY